MLIKLRKGKRAQSLVIVALSATALFGIIALGLDAGRLYFQRRDVQNAADAGALAGAQELLPTAADTIPTTAMIASAGCQASVYALKGLQDTPRDTSGTDCKPAPGAYIPGSYGGGITEPAARISATVQVWTPSRNNPNEIHVRVTYNVPLTFAAILGFTTSAVVADAYAHGGFFNKTYTVFGFDAGGNGNAVNFDQNGNAQIDDGFNGSDICQPNPDQGRLVSNSKWHAPNPGGDWMNLNGQFYYSQASDTHALIEYWYKSVGTSQPVEGSPNYEAPVKPRLDADPATTSGNVVTYYPGLYRNRSITLNQNNLRYQFSNGIYYLQDSDFTITGGTVSNTSDGQPKFGPFGGVSDLPAATDRTNGVIFVFDGNAKFTAGTSGNTSPSVFFAAPSFVSSGTDSIVFFIKSTDTISGPNGSPWDEEIDGTKGTPGNYPFQIWGSIFNADNNGSHGTVVILKAVSASNGTNRYAVTGEVVSPQVDLDGGNMVTGPYTPNTPGVPPACKSTDYHQSPAGLLVQFNSHYVPHWRGLSYLVR